MKSNIFDLSGKVAVVTGAGSGIGESIAKIFAQQGALVAVLEVNDEAANRVCKDIEKEGGKCATYHCDISNHNQVVDTFRSISDQFGSLDIMVNNAAVAHIGNVESTTEADMDRLYKINIKGAYSCLHAAVKEMKKCGGGAILNLASIASVVALADRFAYSMSKGAILTMTYSVAKDYVAENIRCNAIGPARVHTPFVDGYLAQNYPGREKEMYDKLSKTQPIGRMGTPDEIAHLALYLCSDEAGFVTGSFYPIDGGFITLNG
jgi:NAD(P)-dependent dehydrogenase (short-subunit alcohol dehydrogenase family)